MLCEKSSFGITNCKSKSDCSFTKYLLHFDYRQMQEVQLDKHIRLLDSPGVVMATGTSDTSIVLKNCVRVSLNHVILCNETPQS